MSKISIVVVLGPGQLWACEKHKQRRRRRTTAANFGKNLVLIWQYRMKPRHSLWDVGGVAWKREKPLNCRSLAVDMWELAALFKYRCVCNQRKQCECHQEPEKYFGITASSSKTTVPRHKRETPRQARTPRQRRLYEFWASWMEKVIEPLSLSCWGRETNCMTKQPNHSRQTWVSAAPIPSSTTWDSPNL